MAVPVYTKKTASNGQVQYRKDGDLVAKAKIPEDVLAKLNIAAEGTEVPESADVVATDDNIATPPVTPGNGDDKGEGQGDGDNDSKPSDSSNDDAKPEPKQGKGKQQKKLVKIHLERNHMINGKVYLGGYNTEYDEETGEVVEETPIEIEVDEDMAEELKRNDRNHTTYERNLHRGQNKARTAPQVKDVKATD